MRRDGLGPDPRPRCTGGVADRAAWERLSGSPAAQPPSGTKNDASAGPDEPWLTSAPEPWAWLGAELLAERRSSRTGAGMPGASMRCRRVHCRGRVDAPRHPRCPRSAADRSRRLHPWSSSAGSAGRGHHFPLTNPLTLGQIGLRDGEMDDYSDRHVLAVIATLRKAAARRPRRHRGRNVRWRTRRVLHFKYTVVHPGVYHAARQ